jgi:hypothetical protein
MEWKILLYITLRPLINVKEIFLTFLALLQGNILVQVNAEIIFLELKSYDILQYYTAQMTGVGRHYI